nr:MAG TPA: hypothetical protein [Caudoviricetes sp.]
MLTDIYPVQLPPFPVTTGAVVLIDGQYSSGSIYGQVDLSQPPLLVVTSKAYMQMNPDITAIYHAFELYNLLTWDTEFRIPNI